jgi:hypothetical protein
MAVMSSPSRLLRACVLLFGLVLGFTATLAATGCKPSYVDPVTHEVIACDQMPPITIANTLAEIGQIPRLPDGGLNLTAIALYVVGKGVAVGGCAAAEFFNNLLAPAPGEAMPPPELARAYKATLEQVRETFELAADEQNGDAPKPNITWKNADGELQ